MAAGRSSLGLSYEQMKRELDKLHRKNDSARGMLPISVPRNSGCMERIA